MVFNGEAFEDDMKAFFESLSKIDQSMAALLQRNFQEFPKTDTDDTRKATRAQFNEAIKSALVDRTVQAEGTK